MLVRRIARPLLAAAFVAEGVSALRNTRRRAEQAATLIQAGEAHLPPRVSERVPSNPETLVRINAATQIGGGLLLALGRAPRLSSAALAGSFVPTTINNDAFWEEQDPTIRAAKRADFLKNLSLLGGLTIAAVDTEGKPSLGWRGRRALRRASASVAAAVPSGSRRTKAGKRLRKAAHVAAERGQELGEAARESGAHLADVTRERGPEIAHEARERGSKIVEVVRDRGGELADSAKDAVATYRAS
jgi:uncharacterized membrane protein YphA (DoxX/SURF4 family)